MAEIVRITSRQNPLIVGAAALKEKKYRDEQKTFLLEGRKLFEEAVQSKVGIVNVFATEENVPFCAGLVPEEKIVCVPDAVLEKISTEKAPQGIICSAKYIDKLHFLDKIEYKGRFFFLSSVRDPGNLGTVLRSAAAFGADHVLVSADCADLYNPRTVRASMGALFRQQITVCSDPEDTVRALRAHGYEVYAAMLAPSASLLTDLTVTEKTVFVVGNEGHGISESLASACTGRVLIPMAQGSVESLNAAVASSVLLWHTFASLQ